MDALPKHQRHTSSAAGSRAGSTSGSTGSGTTSNVGLNILKSPSSLSPSSAAAAATASSSGSTHRDQQVEKLLKEVKHLKQKVDILDKENVALKKSIYDLSARYAASISQGGLSYRPGPFVIENDATANSKAMIGSKAQEVISMAVQEAGGNVDGYQPGYAHDGKAFEMRYELKGHTAAVYTVEFSPNGSLLASGSFDKTVRIWDTASAQKEMMCLKGHTLNISDVAWTSESNMLVSGGFDETCKTWDVDTGKLAASFEMEGFVQCVGWDFMNSNIFYAGTSRKVLATVDTRVPAPNNTTIIRNDAMVNTLYASRDGVHVITGDAQGMLKVWDIRSQTCISSAANGTGKMPITHITIGRRRTDASRRAVDDYDEPRYMAVNSFDNILRIYDRGMDPPKSDTRLVHTLKGFKNKNWPVKSSFYCGSGYNASILTRSSAATVGDKDSDSHFGSSSDYLDLPEMKEEKSVLLATGSADPYAYIYNVGEDNAELMQRLEGHSDRVYTVNFHPTEPILASGSADFTVKVWGPTPSRGKKKTIV
ncbi:WD40-repeat-containing domain protein [Phascolomyces articulosus]|uniref:WD40-repeat-containing domain protein n=1 Tax=Phascolomyces articulosus TaxID=60185 RepID=A0AAD5PJN7_9FUNG|nr:WD40-repeat-containing domain protein [Phascolomyces articulosus]